MQRFTLQFGSVFLAASALALSGCAAQECLPQIVKTPVYSCPKPPAIKQARGWVYELKPDDSSDKVVVYVENYIDELETSNTACNNALDAYRK